MTYPEMNAEIAGLLRTGTTPVDKYAADRIEELERQLNQAIDACQTLVKFEIYFGDACPLCEGIRLYRGSPEQDRLSDGIMEHGPGCPITLAEDAITLAMPPEVEDER